MAVYKRKTMYFHEMPTDVKQTIKKYRFVGEKWQDTIYRLLIEKKHVK
jgi:hypothetical protein